jgi:hypothetical protein
MGANAASASASASANASGKWLSLPTAPLAPDVYDRRKLLQVGTAGVGYSAF